MKVDYVDSDQFSVYVDFGETKQRLTPKAAIELRDKLDIVIKKYDPLKSTKVCDWCGENTNKKGNLLEKYYHEECIEGIINGDGIC